MTIFDPECQVTQTHSELGTDVMTGTIRLEGPYCLNDYSLKNSEAHTVIKLWTTMGVASFLDGSELEREFIQLIKSCFLGKTRPGDYTGLLRNPDYHPLMKRLCNEDSPKYDLAIVTARYGVSSDAEQAIKLFDIFNKQNNIPTIVLVTHSGDNTTWDLVSGIDPGSIFFVENYLPKEAVTLQKNKRLLLPILEAVKKVERSDVFWSRAEESVSDVVRARKNDAQRHVKKMAEKVQFTWFLIGFIVLTLFAFGVGMVIGWAE